MEEQKLKKLIEKAINKGWVFYGEFNPDVATESVLKLLKEQLHIPDVVGRSEQLPIKCIDQIDKELCERIGWCKLCRNIDR